VTSPLGFHVRLSLLMTAALTFEYWALGPFSWMYGFGASLDGVPAHLALKETGSTFALWTPAVAGGVDRLAVWGGSHDPLNLEPLLFALFPPWFATGIHLCLQRFVSMFFTMRVCGEQLRLDTRWSAVAGIAMGCLSFPVVGYMFSDMGFPFVLWVVGRLPQLTRAYLWAPLAGLGVSSLSSFVWAQPYVPLVALAWFAFVVAERSPRLYGAAVLFFAGMLLGDLPQGVALAMNSATSQRASWPPETVSMSISGLFYHPPVHDYFNQDQVMKAVSFVGPIAAVVLGLAAAAMLGRAYREVRLFCRVVSLYVLVSLKVLFVPLQLAVALNVPWIGGIYLGRLYAVPAAFLIASLVALSALLLAQAFGQHTRRMVGPRWAGRIVTVVAVSTLVFAIVRPRVFLFHSLMVDSYGQGEFQVDALERLRMSEREPFRVGSVLPLQPSYAFGQGLETIDGRVNLYPAVYQELWFRILTPLLNELPANRAILGADGGRPQDIYLFLGLDLVTPGVGRLPDEDPAAALKTGFDIDRRFNSNLLSLLNTKYLLSEYPLRGGYLRLVHAPAVWPDRPVSRDYATGLINGPHTHSDAETLVGLPPWVRATAAAIRRKRQGKDLFVYENTQSLPRFRFVREIIAEQSDDAVLDRLSSMSVAELRGAAVMRSDTLDALGTPPRVLLEGTVTIRQYRPDGIELEIHSSDDGFLTIANTWHPAWRAEVDGTFRPLVRVNHAQQGLRTTAADRIIRLTYEPSYSWVPFLGRSI
jgi:hypothetical protein